MPTDIRFYHLTVTSLDRALPQLLEKAHAAHFRILVKAADEQNVEELNTHLWTFSPNAFLPHGSAKDGAPTEQPIFLSHLYFNANSANLLAVTDGTSPDSFEGYERVLDLFDGADETAVQAARQRWKEYKNLGHALQYWQQTESGGWVQKGT